MRYRNLVLFLALSAIWGSAFTAIKAGLAYFPPVLFAALRYDIAAVLMLGYAAVVTDRWRPRGTEWWVVGVGSLLMIAAYHAFLFVGEQFTTSAAAAVIVGLNPILTAGFARGLLPDERLTLLGVVGLLVGLAGVGILAQPEPTNLFGGDAVGELLVLAAAASFSLGSVLSRRGPQLPIETMEAWSMAGGAVIMHVVSLGIGEPQTFVATPTGLLALAYLSVVASAIGFLIYFDLLDRLGPVELNMVSYAAPVAAAVTGFLFLTEVPTAATAVGFAVVVAGFALIKRDALRDELARVRGRATGRRS